MSSKSADPSPPAAFDCSGTLVANPNHPMFGNACLSKRFGRRNRKPKLHLLLAALAGAAIVVSPAKLLHAQQAKAARAYRIAEVGVTDPATFQKYSAQVAGTRLPFHGQYLLREGRTVSLEGEPPQRVVVIVRQSSDCAALVRFTSVTCDQADTAKLGDERRWIAEGVSGHG